MTLREKIKIEACNHWGIAEGVWEYGLGFPHPTLTEDELLDFCVHLIYFEREKIKNNLKTIKCLTEQDLTDIFKNEDL